LLGNKTSHCLEINIVAYFVSDICVYACSTKNVDIAIRLLPRSFIQTTLIERDETILLASSIRNIFS